MVRRGGSGPGEGAALHDQLWLEDCTEKSSCADVQTHWFETLCRLLTSYVFLFLCFEVLTSVCLVWARCSFVPYSRCQADRCPDFGQGLKMRAVPPSDWWKWWLTESWPRLSGSSPGLGQRSDFNSCLLWQPLAVWADLIICGFGRLCSLKIVYIVMLLKCYGSVVWENRTRKSKGKKRLLDNFKLCVR